jgi:hypothetical protein
VEAFAARTAQPFGAGSVSSRGQARRDPYLGNHCCKSLAIAWSDFATFGSVKDMNSQLHFEQSGCSAPLSTMRASSAGQRSQPLGHLAHRVAPTLDRSDSIAFERIYEFVCRHLVLLTSKITKQGDYKSNGYSRSGTRLQFPIKPRLQPILANRFCRIDPEKRAVAPVARQDRLGAPDLCRHRRLLFLKRQIPAD